MATNPKESPGNQESSSGIFNIEALRHQDPVEFERLYYMFANSLRLYLFRLCGDNEIASDLTQETFVKAYRYLPKLYPDTHIRPWLYKIAINTAKSYLRLDYLKRVLPFSDRPVQALTAETLLESRYVEDEVVRQVLLALKPEYTECLLLHWHEGFSIDELCEILNIAKENLKKRLYRAKCAFSAAYAKEYANQSGAKGGG